MRDLMEGIGGVVAAIGIILVNTVIFGSSLGVVREHCLDVGESEARGRVEVDTSWTYIIWPPLMFSPLDPPGRCVRNSPLREGLHQLGVWELPSAEKQVRDHVEDQLREGERVR